MDGHSAALGVQGRACPSLADQDVPVLGVEHGGDVGGGDDDSGEPPPLGDSGAGGRATVVCRSEGWWPTMSRVPPGDTDAASLRNNASRGSFGRCMNCADTRS